MLILQFSVNDRQAQEYFDYAGYHARQMTPVFRQIASLVHDYVEAQFDTEGQMLSGGWAELAEATIADRGGSAHPILEREGILRGDVTDRPRQAGQFGAGGLVYGNGWLTFAPHSERNGADLVEVHTHGRGPNASGKGAMPARPIWETPAAFSAEVSFIAFEWLRELKRANVRRSRLQIPRPSDLEPSYVYDGSL